MEPIPLPSFIHYELLLQLLERQTSFAASQKPEVRDQVQELIITLRKALAQQKQLEQSCQQANLPIEHRWSLNSTSLEQQQSPKVFPLEAKPEIGKLKGNPYS
ncbi:MAG: DUF5340 domain-containing protein [Symploca sp. SIO1C4]|uniref:DUF5340 domain-containing protein n=1 Tax=Symploca sp. SIO1C4 TaxID=2607765 RepID=A0A6B3NC94_9CYAN|nr:DUF5340 domain-containing protein [Symploca sp. SIO1C4]